MCALHKELSLDFSELRFFEIQCAVCGARIAIDLAGKETVIPAACPGCNVGFRGGFEKAVREFRAAYHGFTNLATDAAAPKVGFRIPFDPPGSRRD